ncbi:MAG: DUF1318 domain-containing protein [Verrucomicrobiales bacterium]
MVIASAAVPSCNLPDVNLATRDPLKVDINVRLDVYQYSKAQPEAASDTPKTVESVSERRRNRIAELQTLKNNRLIGENHRGLLSIQDLPAGTDGDYVKKVIEAENQDRVFLMVDRARRENLQMHEVQEREWKLNVERSYAGEWMEVTGDRSGLYKWVKKPKK